MNCIRVKSVNDEYHVVLKFIEELAVFSDIHEREVFIEILLKIMKKKGCKIYANTIMLNHAHMVIKLSREAKLSSVMISLTTQFAKFYNKYHERKGRIFSRRYFSKPINEERYFFSSVKYAFMNPVKAGLVDSPWDYEWSSAHCYLEMKGPFFNCDIYERYNKHFFDATISFEEFIGKPGDDSLILDIERKRYYEREAKQIFIDELGKYGICNLKNHGDIKEARNVIRRLQQIGITFVQMKNFSGMTIQNLKKVLYSF
ncbi:MAG: transposase [Clostridia bacterium]|nr:transposase [Clostridia bacterium]